MLPCLVLERQLAIDYPFFPAAALVLSLPVSTMVLKVLVAASKFLSLLPGL